MIFRKKIEKCFFRETDEEFLQFQCSGNFRSSPNILAILAKIVFLLFLITSCRENSKQISTAFYHWKSELNISGFEKAYLDSCRTKKMYLRMFDVDWDENAKFPKPLAITTPSITKQNVNDKKSDITQSLRIAFIPTVFITNKTFFQINDNQLDTLTKLVFDKINSTFSGLNLKNTEGAAFLEIQIDCDWTERTRDKYFTFLKKLKSFSDLKISSTIRLHQIKDRTIMGIPPVDRGMLMAYNMGNLDNPNTNNSIIDLTVLKSYVKTLKTYPLSLDIALPIFSWGIVLRDGEAVRIINNLTKEDLTEVQRNAVPLDSTQQWNSVSLHNNFIFEKNIYFKGHYLYKDDEIRIEDTPLSILTQAADILSQNLKSEDRMICFYHADYQLFSRYRYEAIQDIVHRFQ